MRNHRLALSIAAALAVAAASSAAFGSEMVYHPVNPTFGGNPLNGSALLSQAQAQGLGTKSGAASPDLSGLDSALSNLGNSNPIVINTGSTGNSGSSGSSGTSSVTNAVRSTVP